MDRRAFVNHLFLSVSAFLGTTLSAKRVHSATHKATLDSRLSLPLQEEQLLAQKPNLTFSPVPAEDKEKGMNSNAHVPGTPEPSDVEKQAFIKTITQYAQTAEKQHNVPACVIVGLAIAESQFGRTRIAYYANNLFKLKYVNRKKGCYDGSCDNVKTYQLVGQPNEVANYAIMITESFGNDRFVFDEGRRFGNRYRVFDSYQDSVNFLVTEVWLKDPDYQKVVAQYASNVKSLGKEAAAKQFVVELVEEGFGQAPGSKAKDYVQKVHGIMEQWKLCR